MKDQSWVLGIAVWALTALAMGGCGESSSNDAPAGQAGAGAATGQGGSAGSAGHAGASAAGHDSGVANDSGEVHDSAVEGDTGSGKDVTTETPPTNVRPLLGVYVGNEPAPVGQFETWLGGPADGVLAYTGDQGWGDADPGWQLSSNFLGGCGRRLFWSIPMTPQAEGADGFRAAAKGQHDSDYQSWADTIVASRANDADPIYIRTTWELGGEWFWWTAAATEDPQAYIGAFQHFAQAFHSRSDRFKMVWDFTGDRGPVEQWYPGDDAVDVISQDVYWNPQWTSTDGAVAFQMICSDWVRGLDWEVTFAAQHGKPMAVSEWGVTGDNAGPFIVAMKAWLKTHSVLYATYWNSNSAYTGQLSYDQFPTTGAVFKQEFGPGSQW